MRLFGTVQLVGHMLCWTPTYGRRPPSEPKYHTARAQALDSSFQEVHPHPSQLLPAFTERLLRACAILIGSSGRRNPSPASLEPPPPPLSPARALPAPARNLARIGARPYFVGN